jgi:hypothetical protein
LVQHIATEDVGAEPVPAGMLQRRAAVELDLGKGRGITRLREVGRKHAVDERARRLEALPDSLAAPRDRIAERDRRKEPEDTERERAPLQQLAARLAPEVAAPRAPQREDREGDERHDRQVRDPVRFHVDPYSSRTRGSASV